MKRYGKQVELTTCYTKFNAEASKNGDSNCCAVISAAILTGISYEESYELHRRFGRKKGHGTYYHTTQSVYRELGYVLKCICFDRKERRAAWCSGGKFGNCCDKMNDYGDLRRARGITSLEKAAANIKGKFLVHTKGHLLAMVDGVVHDHSKGGRRVPLNIYRIEKGTVYPEKNLIVYAEPRYE